MWSVWSKAVEIYLSATGCMLRCGQQPALVLAHPASLPLDRVLTRISEAAQTHAASHGRSCLHRAKLRITLAGSLCPPIPFTTPDGVKNWHELQLLAQTHAAQQLGIQVPQTVCEWDDQQASLLAALPLSWMQALQAWAIREKASITAINPLWTIATQSSLAQAPTVRALYLQEKDGVTLLATPHLQSGLSVESKSSRHVSHGVFIANVGDSTIGDATQQWFNNFGIVNPEILKLSFGESTQTVLKNAPRTWNGHWSQA